LKQTIDLPLKDFRAIHVLLRSRRFDEALALSRETLKLYPNFAEAHYLCGLSALSLNQLADAIDALTRATELEKAAPHYHCNLGEAFRRDGNLDRAVECLNSALSLKPDYEIARYNLGSSLFQKKTYKRALVEFQTLVKAFPDNAGYWVALADTHRELGAIGQAILSYRHALKQSPDNFAGHYNLGLLLLEKAEFGTALEHCQKAVELSPENGLAHSNLGHCFVGLEELDDAMNAYADALEIMPDSSDLMVHIARIWLEVADFAQAAHWFARTLELEPDNIKAQVGVALIKSDNEQTEAALDDLLKLVEKHPDDIEVLKALGQTAWDNGDAEDAIGCFRHIQELIPESPRSYVQIGSILSSSGDIEGAIAEYNKALEQNPNFVPALHGLATTAKARLDPEKVQLMHSLLENTRLREGAKASLHNGLAFYYDRAKQYDKVPAHAVESNRLYWIHRSKRGWHYDPDDYEHYIDKVIHTFDKAYFERVKSFGIRDESPVFIVGMPRSGTTLTEQILSTHAQVLGIGERRFASQAFAELPLVMQKQLEPLALLPELTEETSRIIAGRYLDKLDHLKRKNGAESVIRVVDKMPDNYSQLGWILTLFPRARIIHCRRDIRDVALSCWLTQFGMIRWASNIEHIAHRIEQYQRVMAHWREVFPVPMCELDYEKLVADQEQESRRLFDWIGLDWDEKCLAFYDTERLVRTASVTQVREPIYTTSVARWKPYEEMLAPIMELARRPGVLTS